MSASGVTGWGALAQVSNVPCGVRRWWNSDPDVCTLINSSGTRVLFDPSGIVVIDEAIRWVPITKTWRSDHEQDVTPDKNRHGSVHLPEHWWGSRHGSTSCWMVHVNINKYKFFS